MQSCLELLWIESQLWGIEECLTTMPEWLMNWISLWVYFSLMVSSEAVMNHRLASFPGPTQLSVTCSTEKRWKVEPGSKATIHNVHHPSWVSVSWVGSELQADRLMWPVMSCHIHTHMYAYMSPPFLYTHTHKHHLINVNLILCSAASAYFDCTYVTVFEVC